MVKETLPYRVWKLGVQKVSRRSDDQISRLESDDWDVIIVLDACRSDTLRQVAHWPVGTVQSPASCTPEWLRQLSEAGAFEETYVVSGSPQYKQFDSGAKHVEHFWESHWDEQLQTTLPEPILERVSELRTGREEQIVAHLMQPHWPYLVKLDDSWRIPYDGDRPWQHRGREIDSVQVAMERGYIDVKTAKEAYEAAVVSIWETLVPYLAEWTENATVVVTSDHGEVFGRLRELRFYEHPCKCHISSLTTVPWAVFPQSSDTIKTDESVENRLKNLGYQ